MLCQGVGSLIGGLQEHYIETVLHRQNIPFFQAQFVSAAGFYIINRIMGKGNHFIHGGVFHYHKGRKQLGNTGRRQLYMDILGKENGP